jgi:hypothetical protein
VLHPGMRHGAIRGSDADGSLIVTAHLHGQLRGDRGAHADA